MRFRWKLTTFPEPLAKNFHFVINDKKHVGHGPFSTGFVPKHYLILTDDATCNRVSNANTVYFPAFSIFQF